MSERIPIVRLRHDAEHALKGRMTYERSDELLALVEAVEAAHRIEDKLHIIAADGKRRRNVNALRDALARFDFGERP